MVYAKKTKYKVEIDFDGSWRIRIADKISHDQREGDWVSSWKDFEKGKANSAAEARVEVDKILNKLKEIKRHEEEKSNYEVTI